MSAIRCITEVDGAENRLTADQLVSVIMPAYNVECYIEQSIRSVMSQTHRNLELIVIDDCSTDNTLEIVKAMSDADERITVIENDENLGVAMTRNRGFAAARGEWVALLDSDDVWHEDKLEKQLRVAMRTGCDIVYCSYAMIDEGGRIFSEYIVPESTTYDEMLRESTISCSTALLSRRIFETEQFPHGFYHEDYVYWLRLLKMGYTAAASSELLAEYRVVKDSRSYNKLNAAKMRWNIYRKVEGLSLRRSISAFCSYSVRGFAKHRRRGR